MQFRQMGTCCALVFSKVTGERLEQVKKFLESPAARATIEIYGVAIITVPNDQKDVQDFLKSQKWHTLFKTSGYKTFSKQSENSKSGQSDAEHDDDDDDI